MSERNKSGDLLNPFAPRPCSQNHTHTTNRTCSGRDTTFLGYAIQKVRYIHSIHLPYYKLHMPPSLIPPPVDPTNKMKIALPKPSFLSFLCAKESMHRVRNYATEKPALALNPNVDLIQIPVHRRHRSKL
jgi:hypothetical protein